MVTPSKMRRLSDAAELYIEYAITAQKLCTVITNMTGKMTFPDDWTEDAIAMVKSILDAQEKAFKAKLMPFVEQLEELDKMIKDNLPDPNRRIITPDEAN